MTKQTHLIDKDSTVEDSIDNFQKKLSDAGFTIVEQDFLNPIPNVWSVKIKDQDCPLLFTHGKGSSKKTALASALGKFVENISTHYFWSDCYLGDKISNNKFVHYPHEEWFKSTSDNSWPTGVLNETLQTFYSTKNELNPNDLIDVNSCNRNRGICCIPLECIRTKEAINFPLNIIHNLYAGNGLATGNSIEEARVYALSEILTNFVKFKVIAEGSSLPIIPNEVLNRYPVIQESMKALNKEGYKILIQDASLGGKYPVLALTLLNPNNHGICTIFGGHPNFQVALERCLKTVFSNREFNSFIDFSEAGFDMDEIAGPKNLEAHFNNSNGIVSWNFLNDKTDYNFVDWDKQESSINNIDVFQRLCNIVHQDGNDIYIADHNEIDVYSCRIIVPGLSDIYPADDLVWDNNNAGIDVREQILKINKTNEECERLIEDLEELNQTDEYLVSDLINMPSDEDCIFHDLCIAELITLLALKVQDNERIQEGCEWLLHYKKINPLRLKTYQCINTILQLDFMTHYGSALEKLYTREILNNALALIDGEDVYPLTSEWKTHSKLINAYNKVLNKKTR